MNKEEILVSVIIPIYNVEKYIEKCLLSVIEQKHQNLEIICVNDGTTDRSMNIVLKKAKKDSRIQIINISNSGLSVARNIGLEAARGKYICFLDSDDCLAPETFEELLSIAEKNQADIVFFNAESIYESSELADKQKGYATYYKRNKSYEGCYNGQELFSLMISNHDFKPSACLQLIRHQFLEENEIQFYPGILHEDNLFTLSELLKAQNVVFEDKPYYKRLIRAESITSRKKDIRHAYGFFVCEKQILRYLSNANYSVAFFHALHKYMDIMCTNAVNNIKNMELEQIKKEMEEINNTDTALFLNYIYNKHQGIKESLIKPENTNPIYIRKTNSRLKKIYHKFKRLWYKIKNKVIDMTPDIVIWVFMVLFHWGPGYFLYRKRLKSIPEKICVSIIVPVYNAERYLPAMLDSLIQQNLPNIEIICIDDGSTDSSLQILQRYHQKDGRVIILQQENIGAGEARNKGMRIARGEYLLFLDADDLFDENMCNEVYYQCIRKKADVCLFGAKRIDMQTMKIEPMNWVLHEYELPAKNLFSSRDVSEKLFQITTGCPWSKMFKKEFVDAHKMEFQNLKNTNDAYFVRMCLALAERITTVKRKYVTYRYNEGSNTQSRKSKAPLEFYTAFKAIKESMQKKGIYSTFERTYCNMVLTESLFALETVGTREAKQKVEALLKDEAIEFYGLFQHNADFYYNKTEYAKMRELFQEQ